MKEQAFYIEFLGKPKTIIIKTEEGHICFYDKGNNNMFYSVFTAYWDKTFEAHLLRKSWFTEDMAKFINEEISKDGSSKEHSKQ